MSAAEGLLGSRYRPAKKAGNRRSDQGQKYDGDSHRLSLSSC